MTFSTVITYVLIYLKLDIIIPINVFCVLNFKDSILKMIILYLIYV